MRCLRTFWMLTAVCCLWATAASAECVRFGPSQMNWPGNDFVFDGTVLEVRELDSFWNLVAVLQVHRVFKGQLPARIEVYQPVTSEVPRMEVGQRYVMPIWRQQPSDTGGIGHGPSLPPELDPSLLWAAVNCAGVLRDTLQQDGTLDGFGRGWPPGR